MREITLMDAVQVAVLVRDLIVEYQRQNPGGYPDDEALTKAIRERAGAYLEEGQRWKDRKMEQDASGNPTHGD